MSGADNFTYAPGPVISTVNPTSGSVAGGTSVTISGSGYTGASAVKFGSSPASSFVINSDTQITAVSPPEVAGTVDITVATPGGTSATTPLDSFTFSTTVGCSETWTGATDSHWGTASNWSNGQVPSYNDEACIPSGAPNLPVVLDAGTSPSIRALSNQGSLDVAGNLSITGTSSMSTGSMSVEGRISGPGAFVITGSLTTSGANFYGPGTVTVASGATWAVGTSSSTSLDGGTFVNSGVATVSISANLTINSGATLTNTGTLTMDAAAHITGSNNSNDVFNNTGTLVVTPGLTGTASLNSYLVVNNTGSIKLTSGSIDIYSATLNLNGGSVTGAGTLKNEGTLGINSAQSIASPVVDAGTVTGTSPLTLTGSLTTSGANYYGPGTVTVASGATWAVGTSSSTSLDGGVLVNGGSATVSSSANLTINSGATLTNTGTLTMDAAAHITGSNNSNDVFNNAGTFVVTSRLDRDGRVVQRPRRQQHRISPALIGHPRDLSATLNLNAGSVTGAGTLKNRAPWDQHRPRASPARLVDAGTVTGTEPVTLTGSLTTSGANFNGPGTVTVAKGANWENSSSSTVAVGHWSIEVRRQSMRRPLCRSTRVPPSPTSAP